MLLVEYSWEYLRGNAKEEGVGLDPINSSLQHKNALKMGGCIEFSYCLFFSVSEDGENTARDVYACQQQQHYLNHRYYHPYHRAMKTTIITTTAGGRGGPGVEHRLPKQKVRGSSPGDFAPFWLGYVPAESMVNEKRFGKLRVDPTPGFRLAGGLGGQVFTYAALWDEDKARIVTLVPLNETIKDLLCVFLPGRNQSSESFSVPAKLSIIPENHGATFTAAFIECPLQKAHRLGTVPPAFVGLVLRKHEAAGPQMFLPIDRPLDGLVGDDLRAGRRQRLRDFTVCTPVMHSRYGKASQLVELLELSRLLGAGRVVIYRESVAANVAAVLGLYRDQWEAGSDSLEVVVHPWELPSLLERGVARTMRQERDIHYFGQLAAIDHCLHRYRHLSRHIVFSDVDEFAMPRRHANWSALLAERRAIRRASRQVPLAGFMFRNSVFNKNRPSPAPNYESESRLYGSAVLGLTLRDDDYMRREQRSKMIVDPKWVEVMGIHTIWKRSGIVDDVPPAQGFLAHYRSPLFDCKPQVRDLIVVDRFGEELVTRLKLVWSKLPGVSLGWQPAPKFNESSCKIDTAS
ncbi:hypothetical protein EGW08_016441 [Elysia chlorotica]|uniref:Glycosyltransferase family 92 protein n=1 Tax=Elysia chlorotica TaxID=188477 RepID=A0A433T2N8_ELYCH|nr:hypothetical protein EGW08_016441 [Elysia chlorotica]